jgi:hypothetical protein
MKIEVCEVFDQTKFTLTLVQKWPHQNEVIDFCNKRISKNYHIKSVTFQTNSNKSYSKKVNIFVK